MACTVRKLALAITIACMQYILSIRPPQPSMLAVDILHLADAIICGVWHAQFCGVAIIETKNRAMAVISKLESELDFPRPIRMHWTGCPNSCAQVG